MTGNSQQDLVDMTHKVSNLLSGTVFGFPKSGSRLASRTHEPAIAPYEVRSKNHAVPVVFESLGRVDAAHLP